MGLGMRSSRRLALRGERRLRGSGDGVDGGSGGGDRPAERCPQCGLLECCAGGRAQIDAGALVLSELRLWPSRRLRLEQHAGAGTTKRRDRSRRQRWSRPEVEAEHRLLFDEMSECKWNHILLLLRQHGGAGYIGQMPCGVVGYRRQH